MGDATIARGDVRPGDLVFVGADEDRVSQSVVNLDRGRFSHVGVCVRPGELRSARTHHKGDPRHEIGGVNDDTFAALIDERKRPLYAATPDPAVVDVVTSLKRIEGERIGVPDTDFSFVKLFVVSAALYAFDGTDDVLKRAAARAGRAWDERHRVDRHDPSYFCAEWVSIVFGVDFTFGDLRPPAVDVAPSLHAGDVGVDAPDLGVDLDVLHEWAGSVVRRADDVEERWASVLALAAALYERAPGFMAARAMDFGDLVWEHLSPWWTKLKALAGMDQPIMGEQPYDDAAALPASLVTPRMLEKASWLGEIRRVT